MDATTILIMNTAATLALTGLIWMVQVVHYPLFANVGHAGFADYHRLHTRQITWVVGPLMLCEAFTAWWLLRQPIDVVPDWVFEWAFSLVVFIWGSTALFQIPMHRILSVEFHQRSYERLVLTNWLRTAAWTGRACLVLLALWFVINPSVGS
ncbi:MAG: hypothetical protein VX834_13295 [Myxococcota bacterium]|nr:hypothetical protein [Myxococcota bacterium]